MQQTLLMNTGGQMSYGVNSSGQGMYEEPAVDVLSNSAKRARLEAALGQNPSNFNVQDQQTDG